VKDNAVKVLNVFLAGPSACGKTHAVQAIIPALKKAGFDVIPVLGVDTAASTRARIKGKKRPVLVWDELEPWDMERLVHHAH